MISAYTILQAKKLNVTMKPSTNKNKKLDVFKDNKKIASIGAKGYADYPTYIKTHGKQYADKRRELY
jgi:predicted Zn-dependent protease